MKYRDFVLRLMPHSKGRYRALVTESPFGTGHHVFEIPEALDGYRLASGDEPLGPNRDLSPDVFLELPKTIELDPKAAGEMLFNRVLGGKVGELFMKSHDPQYGLRLQLILEEDEHQQEGPRLYKLPWECLYHHGFLAVDASFSLVRSLERFEAPTLENHVTQADSSFKVLLIGSDPHDTTPLETEREIKLLQAMADADIHFEVLENISREGLHQKLEEGFQAVQFCGHGGFVNNRPVLFFMDEFGDSEGISGGELAEEIRGISRAHWPKLFVLNACHGGAVALGPGGIAGVATDLHSAGIPAVVAMRQEIGDEAAIAFSQSFYSSLKDGQGLDTAMSKARLALKREPQHARDWATPVLFSDGTTCSLFTNHGAMKAPRIWKRMKRIKPAWLVALISLVLGTFSVPWFQDRFSEKKIRLAIDEVLVKEPETEQPFFDRADLMFAFGRVEKIQIVEDKPDWVLSVTIEGKGGQARAALKNIKTGFLEILPWDMPEGWGDSDLAELMNAILYKVLLFFELEKEHKHLPGVTSKQLVANQKALALFEGGEVNRAEKTYLDLLKTTPDDIRALANLTIVLMQQTKYEEALPFAYEATKLLSSLPLLYYHLGYCQIHLGLVDEAKESYNKALLLDPFFAEARHELGKIYLGERAWKSAYENLEVAIRVDPDRSVFQKTMGKLYLEQGAPQMSLAYLQQARSLVDPFDYPQKAEILFHLTKAFEALGERTKATTVLVDFFNLPHADHLPGSKDMQAWSKAWDIELEPFDTPALNRSFKDSPAFAMIVDIAGEVEIVQEKPRRASLYTSLKPGTKIRLKEEAHVSLLCGSGSKTLLEEPGEWVIDDFFCKKGEPLEPSIASLFIAGATKEMSSFGPVLKMKTRPGSMGEFAVLSPRDVTASREPDIYWTEVPGATEYKVYVRSDYGSIQKKLKAGAIEKEIFDFGSESLTVNKMVWPAYPLERGSKFRVWIQATFPSEVKRNIEDMRASVSFLELPQRYDFEYFTDHFHQGQNFRELLILGMRHHGLSGEALLSGLSWVASEKTARGLREVGTSFLELAMFSSAEWALNEGLTLKPNTFERAFLELKLGNLTENRGDLDLAKAHYGRARALFSLTNRQDLASAVDLMIRKLSDKSKAHASKSSGGK